MTVCIAAACEHGKVVVAATDGALSYDGLTMDTDLAKCWWMGDWLFMYSGLPSNADLTFEQVRMMASENEGCLSRKRIRQTVRKAYRTQFVQWVSDAFLAPFDLDIETFKKKGLKILGEKVYSETATGIRDRAQQYTDQLLVVGWGDSELSAVIHEENWYGSSSHSMTGLAAIGTGSQVALSQLLLLGHARHRQLEDTIYSVAAAKFSAEKAEGVGESTTILATWKRRESDRKDKLPLRFIPSDQIKKLREIWEEHGRPQVPASRYKDLQEVSRATEIPNEVRSELGAISEARWKAVTDFISKPRKPGDTIGY